jgi:transposase
MGKPLPIELRQRVVDFVEAGHTHRAAAAQFRVSIKFVNDMVLLKRATGSLVAKPQGNGCAHSMASMPTAPRSGGTCATLA